MNTKKEFRPFGMSDKISYMMGDLGCNLVLTLANSYLLIFYTKVMGVTGAIVGTIFMLARFVDAFTDMAVGRIVDTHTDKKGERFRPWIIYGSVPLVIASCLMYNYFLAGAGMGVKVAWLTITYLLFGSICYTAVNIPYGAMSNVISQDVGHRASLSTWRNVGSNIGNLLFGIAIPMLVYVKDAEGNSVASGSRFLMVSIVLGILAVVALVICWKGSVERLKISNKKDEKESNTKEVIVKCLKDRAILINFGFGIFIYAATQVFMTFNQYMFLDYFGNTSLSGISSIVMFAGIMLSAPFATKLSQKFGMKEVCVVGLALSTTAYVVMFVTRVNSPGLYFLGSFISFFGLGLVSMISYALGNACIDNHFLESGDHTEGTVYAMNSFVRKMSGAICTGIGGWGLSIIGYNELAAVQTEAVRQSLFNIAMALPTICFALAMVFMIFFPLNKKKIEENNKKLEALQNESQANEGNIKDEKL